MRIDDVVYAPQKNAPEPSRRSRSDVALPHDAAAEDVVQLTLGHHGVWEVRAAPPAFDATFEDAARAFASVLPRVSRLYHSLWSVYSPTGITQAIEYARGLLVDVYV